MAGFDGGKREGVLEKNSHLLVTLGISKAVLPERNIRGFTLSEYGRVDLIEIIQTRDK